MENLINETKKSISILLIGLVLMLAFLVNMVSAQTSDNINLFRQDQVAQGGNYNITQLCPNCTYNNITSIYFKNIQLQGQTAMKKSGTEYTYLFNNTNRLGEYVVRGIGDLDGVNTNWAITFIVTKSGYVASGPDVTIYIIELVIGFVCLILFIAGVIKIPYANKRDGFGRIIGINYRKHLKLLSFFGAYFSFLFILWIGYTLGNTYSILDVGSNILRMFFWFFMASLFIIMLAGPIIWFMIIMTDIKLQKKLNRGLRAV